MLLENKHILKEQLCKYSLSEMTLTGLNQEQAYVFVVLSSVYVAYPFRLIFMITLISDLQ